MTIYRPAYFTAGILHHIYTLSAGNNSGNIADYI